MYDLVIRGATVVDGLGREPRRADIAVQDSRIAAIGEVGSNAAEVLDAGGLSMMPGIIDIHTHQPDISHYSALPRLAEELANLPVDVIVADATASTRAAAITAHTIPIVMAVGSVDPVVLGLAHSLARPGGNVTGFTLMAPELNAKRVDLMRTAFQDATALMVLLNPSNSTAEADLRVTEETARSLGFALARVEAATPEALRALGPEALDRGGGPVLVLPDAMFWNHRREIVALAAAARLPALYPEREYADDGGLMGYGPSVPDNFRRAAGYVDRILRGAKPGDLPDPRAVEVRFRRQPQDRAYLRDRAATRDPRGADDVIE
jgi:ABC-type uncharacterized transport system substrate-binding protein